MIAAVLQPPAVAYTGTCSRHSAPQRQRESEKENARTTSEASLATKMCAYPALAGFAVYHLVAFVWHLWCYMLNMVWFTISRRGKRERANRNYTASFLPLVMRPRHRSITHGKFQYFDVDRS